MAQSPHAMHSQSTGENVNRALSILVLDDDTFDRQRLLRLASSFAFPTHVEEADSLFALEEKLDQRSFDVILLDYYLATGDGIDALDIISNHPINQGVARVMVAGAPVYTVAVEAMKHGCDEFIAKSGLKPERLQTTILEAVLASTRKAGSALLGDLEEISNSIANGVAEICLLSIKPRLSRIQRHVEILESHTACHGQNNKAMDAIGRSCSVLHEFFGTLEARESEPQTLDKIVPLK